MQSRPNVEMPENVELRDFGDFDSARKDLYDNTKKALINSYPMSWGGVRMELKDVDYEGSDDFSISDQKKALLEDKYLSRRLRGTVRLVDEKTGQKLDESRMSLMRVPYLTRRGTFIHGGNEYTSIMQSRLLPGVYTRRQENGALETQFNLRQARAGFRVGFEPETTQYRLKIGQANMHMYSLLKDLGVSDERLIKMWGEDIFKANSSRYDARVFGKAYERLVPARERKEDASQEEKAQAIRDALDIAEVHTGVMRKNLPNRFSMQKAAEWQARWFGRTTMIEKVAARAYNTTFKPDLDPEDCLDAFLDRMMFKSAGAEWKEIDDAGPDEKFSPDLKPCDLKTQFSNIYGRCGGRLAGMDKWPAKWMPPGTSELGWLDWYFGYMEGKRTGDDTRQIKRWKSFKARNLARFLKNPTPRMAYSLMNWAIDPMLYLDEESQKSLKPQMKDYKDKKFTKAAEEDVDSAHLKMLLEAKAHSDAKRYGHKGFLIQRSMMDRPDEWVIDTPGGPHPGVTHVPTGFRVHIPTSKIPPSIQIDTTHALSQPAPPEALEINEKTAAFDNSELQALAQFLNREHSAGLPLAIPGPQLEQLILDFIEGNEGINPGMMDIGVQGAEDALEDVKKLNTAKTTQPEINTWDGITKASAEWVKDVHQEITGGKGYPFSYLTGETGELMEEIGKRDWAGIKDEASDAAYAANMIGHQATRLNFPMIGGKGALQKFRTRNAIWQQLMEDRGLEFDVDHLVGGSNYARPGKIQSAFGLAGEEITDEEAEELSEQALSMEKESSESFDELNVKLEKIVMDMEDGPEALTKVASIFTEGTGATNMLERGGTSALQAAGAGLGSAGMTSALLAAAGLGVKRKLPFLGKLFTGAARDGLRVFNPKIALRLAKGVPEAARISAQELSLLKRIGNVKGKKHLATEHIDMDEATRYKQLHKDVRKYINKHGQDPMDTMQEAVGALSGLASAGSGAALATGLNAMPKSAASFDEMFQKQADELAILKKRIREGTKGVEGPKSKDHAEAGNYKKGHFAWKGLSITIENPKGSIRKGKDADGKKWQRTMRHDYGYVKRTESDADGDHIDVFFGEDPDSEIVFVVDQCKPWKPGKPFDEHKCMCGFKTKEAAKKAYLQNYSTGWAGCIAVVPLTLAQFKWWIMEGDSGKALSTQTWHKV